MEGHPDPRYQEGGRAVFQEEKEAKGVAACRRRLWGALFFASGQFLLHFGRCPRVFKYLVLSPFHGDLLRRWKKHGRQSNVEVTTSVE